MILAGILIFGGALGDRIYRMLVFHLDMYGTIVSGVIIAAGGLINSFTIVLIGRGLEGL